MMRRFSIRDAQVDDHLMFSMTAVPLDHFITIVRDDGEVKCLTRAYKFETGPMVDTDDWCETAWREAERKEFIEREFGAIKPMGTA